MRRQFYIAHLIDTAAAAVVGLPGAILATEEVWSPPTPAADYNPAIHFTPEGVADDAVAFFNADEHDIDLTQEGLQIVLYGPFTQDAPAAVFAVTMDDDGYPTTAPLAPIGAASIADVLREWPGNANSDDAVIAWTMACHEALLMRMGRGDAIDLSAILLKNAQNLDLSDAAEDGDEDALAERERLRAEVLALCRG